MADMTWLQEFLNESIPIWQTDPVMFMREVLYFEPDEWQALAAIDLAQSSKVSIKSGQGVKGSEDLRPVNMIHWRMFKPEVIEFFMAWAALQKEGAVVK